MKIVSDEMKNRRNSTETENRPLSPSTGELVFSSKVNNMFMCVLHDIPYGNYIIEYIDNRELDNEYLRIKELKQEICVDKLYINKQATLVNKYPECELYLCFENTLTKEQIPLSNTDIIIKKYGTDKVWFSSKTNSEGIVTWYCDIGNIYTVYVEGEIFTTFEI